MSHLTELSVNSTPRWPVTTEPHLTPSQSSELQSLTRERRSEDQEVFNTEEMSSFQFSALPAEPATEDIDLSSEPQDLTPSANDCDLYLTHPNYIYFDVLIKAKFRI